MIKRIFATLLLLIGLCTTALANQEVSIKLDQNNRVYSERLGFAYITFEYLYNNGNNARVRVSVENITQNPPLAVLVFRRDLDERSLKQLKPKIEFEKRYPGEKGKRCVIGFKADYKYMDIITAAETDTLFTLNVPLTSARDIKIPMYVAKYKPKDLCKKGENNITYKIFEEYIYAIHIEVVGWSEEDPTYMDTKKAVDEFLSSLNNKKFCYNKRHSPSLKGQQRPYQEKKDSLIQAIKNILDTNAEWMSTDAPHRAYSQLLLELEKVNLNSMTYDCGEHKPKSKVHNCSFCSLSAQDIYQYLDDLYQQLYAGKINKDQALRTAKTLYNCYQQNKKRKKDSSYGSKISRFYNSISNY